MTAHAFAGLTIREFVDRLSSPDPVPGGGSASAVAASFAAGLIAMVAHLSLDRPKYAPYESTHRRVLAFAERAAPQFLELADRDADAYAALAVALKLPRDTDAEQASRSEAIHAAARHAAEVPLQVVRQCVELEAEVESMAGRSNLNASSDVNVAALLAEAAGRGAAANVLVNLPAAGDETFAGAATDEVMRMLSSLEDLSAHARERVGAGRLRDPESE